MTAVLVSSAVLGVLLPARQARGDSAWFATFYTGHFAGSGNGDMLAFRFRDTYLSALGLVWQFDQSPPHVQWELEGVAVTHFGEQHHAEVAAAIAVRWVTFPWDTYIDTSLAFGSGLSYATEEPVVEARENPDTGATRLLHYLLVEMAFEVPRAPRWSIVTRIHHRSGVWGLFDGVGRASNFLAIGLRYRF